MQSEIKYIYKTNKTKRRVMINVYPDGRVVVTIPAIVPPHLAKPFVDRKLPWIRKRLEFYKSPKIFDWKNHKPVTTAEALEFVTAKIEKFNAYYKVKIGTIKVKEYRGMWGACVNRKDLVFNAKIVALPAEQSDYIIVHELCHIREFNHGKKFWQLVAEQIPDHKRIRKDLKFYSVY